MVALCILFPFFGSVTITEFLNLTLKLIRTNLIELFSFSHIPRVVHSQGKAEHEEEEEVKWKIQNLITEKTFSY